MNMKKYLKTKILDLINNIEEYKEIHNHGSKNIYQEFRLEEIEEIRHYLFKGVNQCIKSINDKEA